jgi:hypothetical protein
MIFVLRTSFQHHQIFVIEDEIRALVEFGKHRKRLVEIIRELQCGLIAISGLNGQARKRRRNRTPKVSYRPDH